MRNTAALQACLCRQASMKRSSAKFLFALFNVHVTTGIVYVGEIRQSFLVVWFYEHRNNSIYMLAKDSNDLISLLRWVFCHSPLQNRQLISLILWIFRIDKPKALSLLLHTADISHPAKAWDLHHRWTMSLLEEFFRQVKLGKCFCISAAQRECSVGQGSRKIWTQIFSFSDFL